MEPEEVQEVQVQPIENNSVNYIILAIAEPQPIRRTERARNASDRQVFLCYWSFPLFKSQEILLLL